MRASCKTKLDRRKKNDDEEEEKEWSYPDLSLILDHMIILVYFCFCLCWKWCTNQQSMNSSTTF
jgi:hypothetical protein